MADRVDAGVKAMKPTGPGRSLDDVDAEPELPELPDADDAVLAAGEPSDRSVPLRRAWMRFGADNAREVIHLGHDAEVEVEIRAGETTKVTGV